MIDLHRHLMSGWRRDKLDIGEACVQKHHIEAIKGLSAFAESCAIDFIPVESDEGWARRVQNLIQHSMFQSPRYVRLIDMIELVHQTMWNTLRAGGVNRVSAAR